MQGSEVITTIAAFVVALSVLIAVHEFGHFWVARRLGVKVLRFSIGFGRPLWRLKRKTDETEYVIAAIPLGGYVKMLDEREGEVAPEELNRAFNRQPVLHRFAIVAAGPVCNLLFAIFAYWLMFIVGVPGLKPIVGEVEPGSVAAAAGFTPGMEVIAVGDESTPTWGSVLETLVPYALRQQAAVVTAERDGHRAQYTLHLERLPQDLKSEELPGTIGLIPFRPPLLPIIGEVLADSPAARAGIKQGDRVLAVNGKTIGDWEELLLVIRDNPGRPIALDVERNGERQRIEVRPERHETADGPVGRIGAMVQVDPKALAPLQTIQQLGPWRAAQAAVARTWDMSTLTLRMLGEMLVGRASVENLSGPITIARYAGATASAGLAQFLGFLAIVSLSLGVLNLLPIPVLDGGHLMFYMAEIVRGRPVSEQAEMVAQKIGLAVLLLLMMVAFYNDLIRLAG